MIFTKVGIIIAFSVIFAIGLYATPDVFAETYTVENAQGSSTPGCEDTNECFLPATVTIAPGDTVEFVNNDNAAHTSTAGSPQDCPSGVWDSSLVMMGTSFTTPALDAGEYPYFCMVHPWMQGIVIVGEGGAQTTSEEASQAEAELRCKMLREVDPNHNVYVGPVGMWMPWDPDAYKTGRVEYLEEELVGKT